MTVGGAGADHSKHQSCKTTLAPRSVGFAHQFSQYNAALPARAALLQCQSQPADDSFLQTSWRSAPNLFQAAATSRLLSGKLGPTCRGSHSCIQTDNRYQDTGSAPPGPSWWGRGGGCTVLCVGLGWLDPSTKSRVATTSELQTAANTSSNGISFR